MHIHHIAIWAKDLENLKTFYVDYFGATAGDKYINPRNQFESYFLTFDSGARLELMHMPGIGQLEKSPESQFIGYIHLAISTGSKARVDELIERLRQGGYVVLDGPRTTGDGYYEGTVLDPEGNRVEITI